MAGGTFKPYGGRNAFDAPSPRPPARQSTSLVPFNESYALSATLKQRAASVTYGSARLLVRVAVIVALLGVLGFGALYAKLSHSPISMSFLVAPVERAVNRALSGLHFDIGDAVLRRSDKGFGVEFRLTAVRLVEDGGGPIVESPFASASVNLQALLTGHLAAGRIDLIGPRLFLQYSNERGMALSFVESRETKGDLGTAGRRDAPPTPGGPRWEAQTTESQAVEGPGTAAVPQSMIRQARGRAVNLTRAFNDIFAATRRGESAYLTSFGIRDATVLFDRGDQITRWAIPSVEVDLQHRGKNSAVVGEVAIQSSTDAFQVRFRASQNGRTGELDLSLGVDDIVPRDLGAEFPMFNVPKILGMPVSLAADLELAGNGDILSANVRGSLKQGSIYAPWDERFPAEIDRGDLQLNYSREEGVIRLTQSELRWGGSSLKVRGVIQRQKETGRWAFQLAADEIILGAEQFGIPVIPLDQMLAQGEYDPRRGAVDLDRFFLRAADAQINLSGSFIQGQTSPAIKLTGQISPMPIAFFKLIWPKFIAHGARDWIGTRMPQGRIAGGTVKIDIPAEALASLPAGGHLAAEAVDFRLDLEDLEVHYIKNMPPVHAFKSTAVVAGQRFFFTVPKGMIALPSGARIDFTDGEFIVGDLRPRIPAAEIHFKSEAKAVGVLELLDQPPLGYIRALDMKPPELDASVTTTFSLSMPLLAELKFKDIKINGWAQLANVRANNLPGGVGVNGGDLDFDVSEKAIEARGELKMNGLPVLVAWQRIFDAGPEQQPPLRLRTVIDEAARKEMGLDVSHLLRGGIACEVTINLRKASPPLVHFEANLTETDVLMGGFGWRKPPGQRAVLTLDIEAAQQAGGLDLKNFNLQGDQLTMQGSLSVDEKHQPVAFNFPVVSLSSQTQLEMSGELGRNNVWQVRAKGSSYDGRQFFRSLFSAGQVAEDQPLPPKDAPGVDMKVEFGTVIGFFDTTLKAVSVEAKRRGGKLIDLEVHGQLNGEWPLAARIEAKKGQPRQLLAEATNAGDAFRLVGFYPFARRGAVSLKVNLDGTGNAEKTGVLYASNFLVANDQVVGEVLSGSKGQRANLKAAQAQPEYSDQLKFDRMRVPFSVGYGQFVVHDAAINGPLLGATLRGSIDFKREQVNLSGTYVPLYGLNGALGTIPIIGDLFSGRSGEGVFGITFAVKGPNSKPDVQVNPLSLLAPGFLRQLFEFDQSVPHIIPPDQRGPDSSNERASNVPPATR